MHRKLHQQQMFSKHTSRDLCQQHQQTVTPSERTNARTNVLTPFPRIQDMYPIMITLPKQIGQHICFEGVEVCIFSPESEFHLMSTPIRNEK